MERFLSGCSPSVCRCVRVSDTGDSGAILFLILHSTRLVVSLQIKPTKVRRTFVTPASQNDYGYSHAFDVCRCVRARGRNISTPINNTSSECSHTTCCSFSGTYYMDPHTHTHARIRTPGLCVSPPSKRTRALTLAHSKLF